MTPELAGALAALAIALASWLRQEVAERQARAHRAELQRQVADAKHAAGADRRSGDLEAPAQDERRTEGDGREGSAEGRA